MRSAEGGFGKVHVIRFEPGEDVLTGIQSYCEEHRVCNGVVVSGIGSLDGCTFFDPMEIPGKPGCYGYVEPLFRGTPIELVGLSGIICHETDGKIVPHIHASFADKDGNEYGGHLKEGNLVLVTVEVVIAEIEGISMRREMDQLRGVPVLSPEEEEC